MKLKALFLGLVSVFVFYAFSIFTMDFGHRYVHRKNFAELWHEHNPTLISHEIVFDRASSNHEVNGAKIRFYDKRNDLYYERHFEGKEFEKFAQECKSMFNGIPLEDAIIQRVNFDIEKARKDNAINLIALLQPRFSESGTPLNAHFYEYIKPDQKNDPWQGPTKQQIEQILLNLQDQRPSDFSYTQKAFERWAIKHNTAFLKDHLTLLSAISNIRSDQKSFEKLIKGVQGTYATVAEFFRNPRSIKNICDLYKKTIFSGDIENRAEVLIEAQFDAVKKLIINHFITIRHGKVTLYNPSVNIQQIVAEKIAIFFKRCAPEVYTQFLQIASQQSTTFEKVLSDTPYGKKEATDFLTDLPQKTIDFVINQTMREPEFQHNEHFQHLLKLDTLCRSGYIQEAITLANKDILVEQTLINSYHVQLPSKATSDLLNAKSLEIEKTSELSSFPINRFTADVLQVYGKDIKEITQFQSNSLKQLINHNFVVDSINIQAQRVYASKNITEQALALHTIDGLLKAYDLNKKGIIESIPQYLESYRKIAYDFSIEFATNFLKKLSHNTMHPGQYIKDQIVATMRLAHFIVDLSVGQLFRTPSEIKQYFIELNGMISATAQQLKNPSVTDLSNVTAGMLADMVFGGGLGYLSKIGKGLVKQVPRKILEVVQQEHRIATTTEGVQIVVKAEVSQAAKQSGNQAAKASEKIEQQVIQKATQTEKAVEKYTDPQSVAQYDMLKKSLKAEEDAARIQTVYKEIIVKTELFEAITKEEILKKIEGVQSLPEKIYKVIKNAESKFQDYKVFLTDDQNYIIQMTKPGNVQGSKSIYYQKISPKGVTLEMFKDTFDPKGAFLHRKIKT